MRVRKVARYALAVTIVGVLIWQVGPAWTNHPVIVEGNCLNPPAGNSGPVPPGTCGDYDGDGLIGVAEDNDGDRVFGTITAALGPGVGGTGANQNGAVTIVTSGVFAEVVTITGANGNVTLQAAPGVSATIDAVLQGDPGGGGRQASPGIVINAPADRYIILRNLTTRNWTSGVQVLGESRVAIESVWSKGNTNFGIEVRDSARVTIGRSEVLGTGRRVSGAGDFPRVLAPNPGNGIDFSGRSSGTIVNTTVAGSVGAGISADKGTRVCISHVTVFDNNPNLERVRRDGKDCSGHDHH